MTNEDVIRMAKQAGLRRHQENLMSNPPQIRFFYEGYEEYIERFAALVEAAVEEKIAEMVGNCDPRATPKGIAAAIRVRGHHGD